MRTSLNNRRHDRTEEQQLLSGCIAGDPQSSNEFVRKYSNLIYKSVQYTLLRYNIRFNKQDLEDLHNTVFLKLFEKKCRKLRQYRGENGCSVTSWIRLIAVRTVLNALRKRGIDNIAGQRLRVSIEDITEPKDKNAEILAGLETAEQMHLLNKGMRRLLPRERLFMKLYIDKGFSIKRISETLQVSFDIAYTIKHRAIKRLKAFLESQL